MLAKKLRTLALWGALALPAVPAIADDHARATAPEVVTHAGKVDVKWKVQDGNPTLDSLFIIENGKRLRVSPVAMANVLQEAEGTVVRVIGDVHGDAIAVRAILAKTRVACWISKGVDGKGYAQIPQGTPVRVIGWGLSPNEVEPDDNGGDPLYRIKTPDGRVGYTLDMNVDLTDYYITNTIGATGVLGGP
jgi:hypothetical protein